VRGSIGETADEAEALDSRKSRVASRKPDDTWHAPSADTDTDTRQQKIYKKYKNKT